MGEAEEARHPWGRREQVALALVAGVALLVIGRQALRRPGGEVPLLLASPPPQAVVVHVAGEVLMPGIYRLPPGSRWSDAVHAAHGATYLADLQAVNLAQVLRDGERVFIPRLPDPVLPQDGAEQAGEGSGTRPAARQSSADLNTATAADLEALPGIGPVLAGRIVEYRRVHGRFQRLEDLLDVDGVGPRLLERLRPVLRVR